VLGKVTAYNNKAALYEIYESLLPIFLSASVSTSLRILAFDQLLLTDQKDFENHIITILKKNENQQLKAYIAQKLSSLLKDADFKKDKQEFITSFSKLLKENEISLDILAHQPEVESKSAFSGMFAYLPYLPDHLKDFILKSVLSSVYEVNGVFPQYYHSETVLKAFNNLIHIFEAGGYFEGLEDIAIIFQKTFEGINPKNMSFGEVIQVMKLAIENLYRENGKSQVEYSFDGRVTENIKKLYDLYLQFHPKAMPSFNMYFNLFGSTLGFLNTGDMAGMSTKLEKIQSFLSNLRDGVTYNTTRVIRIIEAYHQVPTMMGLPLNWTTNATLAYSVRAGLTLKLNENYEVDSQGFLNPSAALTFLNRMVVDFPTVTQIGVQANSSGYTSTQSKAKLIYTEKKKLLSFEKPSKSQKLLELFRTNQLIRGDQYIDIPDWDIERKISSWCTNDNMNSLLGLEICLDKSYPIVTHRLKPWALMAGWCKWRFVINPFDRKLKSYDLELIKIPQGKSKELILRFSTPGSENSREIYVTANMNETNGEMKFELKPTASSNFLISFIRDIITDSGKNIGYKSVAILKLDKDQQYQLTYKQQDKMEEREDFEDGNKSPKPQKVFLTTDERFLSLETPYNRYSWNIQHFKKGENEQKELLLSFENLNSKENTLSGILPDIYWENESKAYVQFRINWKEPKRNSNSISRQTVCFVHFPKSNIELVGNSLEMSGREQINVNLTRNAKPSGKLLGFLNFTYDLWTSQNSDSVRKEIRLYNITVPCKSWALKLESVFESDSKRYFEVLFTRAVMFPKEKEISDYIGWWNDDVIEDYNLKERKLKLSADMDMHVISGEDLVERYSTLTKNDVSNLNNRLITANIALYYPLQDQEESVTFDGYFILSGAPRIFRFQKNFVMGSSYNDLTLTSHSVFREESSEATLSHSSFFTNTVTQKKAYNIIDYKRSYTAEKCIEREFKHNIKSEVFDLSTNASYKCNSNAENAHTLLLNITTLSSYWNLLNTRLEQIVEDVNSEYSYEEMNFRHPLATINVTAEWLKGDHKKKVIFTCLSNDCANAELFFETLHTGKKTLALDINKGNDKRHYSYERRVSADSKNLNLNIKYSDSKTKLSEAVDFSGQIISARYHIWRGKIDLPILDKIRTRFTSAYSAASKYLSDITKDPEHPINEILRPALKDTVYNFWESIKAKSKEFISLPWTAFKELLHALHPFYWDLQAALTNILHSVKEKSRNAYKEIKERSIIIWAINYFNVPDAFYGSIMNVRTSIKNLLKVFLQDDENLEFEFRTGKLLVLEAFGYWPLISLDPTEFYPFFKKTVEEIKPHHEQGFGTKIAIIFGPTHVYTFDGYVYDVPKYSSDCIFLLAHDLRTSSFTVLSSKEAIHVLFPEISLSINAENEIFVNGSHIPSPLPIQANTVKVSMKKENIIKISSPTLTVICSNTDFLCVLELSMWHRGGTFGLLGNGDGIKNNDMILPNGKLPSGLQEFINSYELSDKPECEELIFPSKPSASEEEKKACNQRFDHLCPQTKELRESFLDACVSDLQDGYDVCYATAGLSALCYYKNTPSTSDCKSMKRDGEKIKHKLEVVLIVQKHHSLTSPEKKNSPNKGIERLITALDEKFKANGYSSVLFSLVGYGGEGVHGEPSLHTAGRTPWIPLQTMENNILKTLEFKGTDEADNLEALKYAAEVLGYDTFDSKIFIMLTESDKQSKNKATVDLIRRHLEKNGITLYTISSYRSLEKGKKVFGLRADGLIFPSPKKGESYLEYPKADLAKLTSATRGSIFLNKFVIANNPASFFSEFADEVWAKVRKEVQSCRDCKTVRSGWWSYLQECSVVHC
ncbi:uncharacterized protein LOC118185843, partial [Stegodyphus dumicola]|uniref:uncharacterized protein LOC118185843 n=1 Tax=Stegodyphus dumicola TaxID=202533 RepID=UPI0015B2FA7A